MTAPVVPSTLSARAPVSAESARSRDDETPSRQARAGVPDSRPAGSPAPAHTRVDQRPAARPTHDRDGPAREAPIETAAPPSARAEPAAPQATRAATSAPTLLEPIPPAVPQAAPAVRNETLVPAPRVEVSPSARAVEPRRPEPPSPMPEPVAAPRVHIGRLEVIVVASSQPPAWPAQRGSADLASRRYLRNA
jgi:ribonuclease E